MFDIYAEFFVNFSRIAPKKLSFSLIFSHFSSYYFHFTYLLIHTHLFLTHNPHEINRWTFENKLFFFASALSRRKNFKNVHRKMTFSQNRTLSLSPRKYRRPSERENVREIFRYKKKEMSIVDPYMCWWHFPYCTKLAQLHNMQFFFSSLHIFVVFTSWHLTSADLLHFKNPMQDEWREKRRRTHTLTSHTGHSFQSSMHISQTEHIAAIFIQVYPVQRTFFF